MKEYADVVIIMYQEIVHLYLHSLAHSRANDASEQVFPVPDLPKII